MLFDTGLIDRKSRIFLKPCFKNLFLFFCFSLLISDNCWAFTKRFSLALNSGYSTIIGNDDTYPKVNIATPLNFGVSLDFYYGEDTDVYSYLGLIYRSAKYLDDSKNNITIENQGAIFDLGLKYDLYWKIFNSGRLITGVRYLNFYYFQSNPLGYIDVKSDLGLVARIGLDYTFFQNPRWSASIQALTGLSLLPRLKNGYANEIEARLNYLPSGEFNYLMAFTYSEFINKTDNSNYTISSDQARVDLNLKLGLERSF